MSQGNEAEVVLKQKRQWEMQLEVSKSCIQKLEARLQKTRRAKADGKFGTSDVDQRLLRELDDLVKQRDRLSQESQVLEEQAEEHDRQVQAFVHVLKALPMRTQLLKQEVLAAEEEVKMYQKKMPVGGLDMGKHQELTDELWQCQLWGEETAEQQGFCERQAQKLQQEMMKLKAEAQVAREEEAAARQEMLSTKVQYAECSMAYRQQQVTKAHCQRGVQKLEATLARARQDVLAEQREQKVSTAKLEAKCRYLREEVGAFRFSAWNDLARFLQHIKHFSSGQASHKAIDPLRSSFFPGKCFFRFGRHRCLAGGRERGVAATSHGDTRAMWSRNGSVGGKHCSNCTATARWWRSPGWEFLTVHCCTVLLP